MALINCPECNKEISDKVKSCPHCGYPFDDSPEEKKPLMNLKKSTSSKKKLIFIMVSAIVVVVIAAIAIISINNARMQAANQAKLVEEKAKISALFKDSINKITIAGINSGQACSIILQVWSSSVNSLSSGGHDFNEVFKYMFSGDIKNHDNSDIGLYKSGFSTSFWGSIAEEMNTFKSRLNNLVLEKASIDNNLEQIKQINRDEYEKEIDTIINYYNSYLKLYNAATSPSGNLLNYSTNLIQMKSDYDSSKVQAEMLIK